MIGWSAAAAFVCQIPNRSGALLLKFLVQHG